jgi:hypothetical protein
VAGGRRRNHKACGGIPRTKIHDVCFRVAVFVASLGPPPVLRVIINPKPAAFRMQPNSGIDPLNRDGGSIGRRVGSNATATMGANPLSMIFQNAPTRITLRTLKTRF